MNDKTLKTISSLGYKQQDPDISLAKLYQKRVDSKRLCETNDKLFINLWEYDRNVYTLEITAEYDGVWWKLEAYSLSEKDVSEKITQLENRLVFLFNSI